MGRPLGFAPEAALEALGLPREGRVWRWGSCLVTGVLATPGPQGGWWLGRQEIECSRRVWQPVLASTLQYFSLEKPPDREAWQATVCRVTKSWTLPKWSCVHRLKTFCLWQLCPSESWTWRWCSCLACGDPGGAKRAGTRAASAAGVTALWESFFEPLVAGDQKVSLASLSPQLRPFRHLEGSLAWGPPLLFPASGT